MARRVGWILSLVVLSVTGVMGIVNGFDEWRDAYTVLQQTVTGGVLLYGVLGIIAAYGLLRHRRWAAWAAAVWGVAIIYVSSTAALAFAPDASLGAAFAAGLGSAVIAALVVWSARLSAH